MCACNRASCGLIAADCSNSRVIIAARDCATEGNLAWPRGLVYAFFALDTGE